MVTPTRKSDSVFSPSLLIFYENHNQECPLIGAIFSVNLEKCPVNVQGLKKPHSVGNKARISKHREQENKAR